MKFFIQNILLLIFIAPLFASCSEPSDLEKQLQVWRIEKILQEDDTKFFLSLSEYDTEPGRLLAQNNAHFLSELKHLENFTVTDNFSNAALNDSVYSSLAKLQNLKSITITGSFIGDSGLEVIAKLPKLDDLHLLYEIGKISNEGIACLKDNKTLRSLRLRACDGDGDDVFSIDGEAIKIISTISNLESLSIGCKNISSQSILDIVKLAKLETLDISGSALENVDYSPIALLKELKYLFLNTSVSASTKDQLRQMLLENNSDLLISFGTYEELLEFGRRLSNEIRRE
ncbi:MAG: hypothetical protein NUW37_18490 [Planctomycetes bacterium]|nr:hypothetical protein [Planctomycetota bacterium]